MTGDDDTAVSATRGAGGQGDEDGDAEATDGSHWFVYVLLSAAGRTYVGVTTDPERRLDQHNGLLPGGARATRAGRPWTCAALRGPVADRAEAQRLEHRLKKKRGRARIAALPTLEA